MLCYYKKTNKDTYLNKVILEPIITKEDLYWNINRKLSNLVAYDFYINEKALEKYLQYINDEIEYLENIINQLGGEK
jgi:hypothetical protein